MYAIEESFFFAYRATIAQFAAKVHLPVIYGAREYAVAGGSMSYGPNYEALYRRAAGYIDKLLRGAKPSELPIEQPTRFEFTVNLRPAKVLGLIIPESILVQAAEVIRWRSATTCSVPRRLG